MPLALTRRSSPRWRASNRLRQWRSPASSGCARREVATGLAGLGALLVMHGLLMPETPSLAALRGRISELGAGPLLIDLARQVMRPPSVAFAIATCLDAAYLGLYKSLSGLVAAGPPLLQHAGDDEHEPERYMEIWLSSIREIGNQGQANGRP